MRLKYMIALMSLAAASLFCGAQSDAKKPVLRKVQMGIVAHRGFWNCEEAGYAKNSIAALRCAQENGFWGSEFDVNMTSDGVLLVYHDDKINGKRIEKHPYSEFKDVTIANGETIPTIDQYLEQGLKYPKTMLVYELKPHSSKEVEDRFVDLTIEKLKEYDLLNPKRVMFISFSYHMCCRLAELLPDFTVQYLGGDKSPHKVKEDGINGIDYNHAIFAVMQKWPEEARELKMTTNIWTVNKENQIRKAVEHGIMYVTTDNPLEARKVLKEEGKKEVR